MNLDYNLVNELKEIILKSYNEALKLDKNVRNKELNDIVTDVDIYMESKIIGKIKEIFPEHSIYSEEKGEIIGESEYTWFIDPIDGTINFAAGIPLGNKREKIDTMLVTNGKIHNELVEILNKN